MTEERDPAEMSDEEYYDEITDLANVVLANVRHWPSECVELANGVLYYREQSAIAQEESEKQARMLGQATEEIISLLSRINDIERKMRRG